MKFDHVEFNACSQRKFISSYDDINLEYTYDIKVRFNKHHNIARERDLRELLLNELLKDYGSDLTAMELFPESFV